MGDSFGLERHGAFPKSMNQVKSYFSQNPVRDKYDPEHSSLLHM